MLFEIAGGRFARRCVATGCARAAIILLFVILSPAGSYAALEPGIATPAGVRTDRIIVRAREGTPAAAIQRLHGNLGTTVAQTFAHERAGSVVQLPPGLSVAQAIAAFTSSGLVEYAEPDFLLHALVSPNDFNYVNQDQWNLHNTGVYGGVVGADIMAEQGWDLQREAPTVIVAVVDSGVRYTHEDLAANMWTNPGETGLDSRGRDKRTNNVDDDGNGYIDDVYGINVLTRSGNPMDDWGHGTHVAGIVGAVGNNGVGVTGVAWRVKIMAVKFIDAAANYSVSDAITALDYARLNGAKIITASWGGYAFNSGALRNAFSALRSAGIIVAAAAGNDNNNNDVTPLYPASYNFDNIIAVAATDRTDTRAGYSNYGATTVHLGAPGSPVFSTWAGTDRDYRYNEGTSMAAPHLAGAAALLRTRFPADTHQQIIQRILSSVDPLPSLTGRTKSNGRLNLAAALGSGSAPPPPPPPPSVLPAPSGLTATAASSSAINLNWTDNSSTETGFEVQRSTDGTTFSAAVSVGANVTSATVTGLNASTTYYFRVRAVQDSVTSAFSNTASATTQAPPPPPPPPPTGTWQSSDIGAVAAAGSASESSGTVTLRGSGADIWEGADEFRYYYQSLTGDGEIVARITGLTNTNAWAKAGVMMRETPGATSRHAFMCVTVANGTAFQRRTATAGPSASTSGYLGSALPTWMRIVRTGNIFTGFESTNGSTWTQIGAVTLDLPATVYVGLAVTSHNDGTLCTATFDQVSLNGGSAPPPAPITVAAPSGLTATAVSASQIDLAWTDNSTNETAFQVERSTDQQTFTLVGTTAANTPRYSDGALAASTTYYYRVRAIADSVTSSYSALASATTQSSGAPPAWLQADIGNVGIAGSGTISGNMATVRGSGGDIWEGADAFRFVYRQITGDCTIDAQVSSITNTHAWAKAGVMIRESLSANARNAFALVTPGNGVFAQSRLATGGATTATAGTWYATAPYWLRLVRTGTRVIAYESGNGSTWTQIAAFDLALNASIYVGLAVTSHDNTQLNTAVFTDPVIR
jgi:subtilisin family serine protease/regulation of enolase protein 1 (concanavalin A-like superfamily)